jgi:hypothetical protein
MDDLALVAAFESTELDGNAFTHVEHLRVAWHYLRTLPLGEAIDRCRDGIRRFAATKGAPDKYHETLTVAFLLVINERLADARHLSWMEFSAANADLVGKPSVLSNYYSENVLRSDRARRVFVMPDLALVEAGTIG